MILRQIFAFFRHTGWQVDQMPRTGRILDKSYSHSGNVKNRNTEDEENRSQSDHNHSTVRLYGPNWGRCRDAKPNTHWCLLQHVYANNKRPSDALRSADGQALHAAVAGQSCVAGAAVQAHNSGTLPGRVLTYWQGFAMQWPWAVHHINTAAIDIGRINDASADLFGGLRRFLNSALSKDQNDEKDCTYTGCDRGTIGLHGNKRRRVCRADGHSVKQLWQRAYANSERPANALRSTNGRTFHGALTAAGQTAYALISTGRQRLGARSFAFGAMISLAACAGTETLAPSQLGSADPRPAFVAEVFDTVCLQTRPSYDAAAARLTAFGFSQAATGTYYNGRDNLSVKLLGTPAEECSVVWGVRNDPAAYLTAYRNAMKAREPLDLSTSTFRPAGTLDGVTYFNTRSSVK